MTWFLEVDDLWLSQQSVDSCFLEGALLLAFQMDYCQALAAVFLFLAQAEEEAGWVAFVDALPEGASTGP